MTKANDDDAAGGRANASRQIAESPHALTPPPVSPLMQVAATFGNVVERDGSSTEEDREATAAALGRLRERSPAPLVVRNPDGSMRGANSTAQENDLRLLDTFGTNSLPFMLRARFDLENMCTRAGEEGDPYCVAINAGLAVVASIAPTNELEAALAVQMAGTHALACEMMGRTMRNENIDRMNTYLNAATKLQRTFTAQLEALARLRGKGQQTVRVEHVTVESGAQAVVGDVHHHHPRDRRDAATSKPRRRRALPGQDPIGQALPLAGDEERPVSHARRPQHRRAPRKPERP